MTKLKDLERKIKFCKLRSGLHRPTRVFTDKSKYNRKKISKKVDID